jgi:hypothetical protein
MRLIDYKWAEPAKYLENERAMYKAYLHLASRSRKVEL